MKQRERSSLLLVRIIITALLCVATIGSGPTSSHAVAAGQPIGYFALGDSIASGHGLGSETSGCYRSYPKWGDSRKAYPYYVADWFTEAGNDLSSKTQPDDTWKEYGPSPRHLACSGATTEDLKGQVQSVLDDLDSGAYSDVPVLISVTVGADDFHFGDPCNLFKQLYLADDADFA